ncbi:PREDICTED: ecto-NOX disulfide-thiol exchanger 2-like isoform X2 [Priapulus caudatus]|uniref:Ecto-NOX disulfide-thiol exchanger 2-like isoform X2 n=1 Tax=Priapulus caudatus TaxID=37621 RepID=A0ABM1ENX0_PRICU|nr:PREDICTED: ecto-NOX disulfide-thiol exchanger 2-like isoform X2 [Priapulus caudatus]
MNPATNDQPLQFNMNKNKPPMAVPLEELQHQEHSVPSAERDGHNGNSERSQFSDRDHHNSEDREFRLRHEPPPIGPQVPTSAWAPGVPMVPGPAMMHGGPMGDPNMMMGGFGFNPPFGYMPPGPPGPPLPQKEIIHCKSCTLFPPNPNAPPPSTRERPPGCRTVFVGGLPENVTEEIVQEVFDRCGPIISVRMSKKNFCHIRFEQEMIDNELWMQLGESYIGDNAHINRAIELSGYRVRMGSNMDPPNSGRLHVDFAQARDDLYEWECAQRGVMRELRHRQRMEQERLRPPSPPPVVHFSDHEAMAISEQLKNEESFFKASSLLMQWLERGDCSRRNANTFYSMIQSTNSHVRQILNQKQAYEEEAMKFKEQMKQRMQGLLTQFDQIDRVFSAASKQKVWDHFSKPQRKNLDLWRKQCQEIKASSLEEFLSDRQEDEMELSDGEDSGVSAPKKQKTEEELVAHAHMHAQSMQLSNLKEENDQLRCQVDAYKNEVDILKSEHKDLIDYKDNQLKALQNTLESMQKQLMENLRKQKDSGEEIKLRALAAATTDVIIDGQQGLVLMDEARLDGTAEPEVPIPVKAEVAKVPDTSSSGIDGRQISQKDAKLIGLIATFLHVHPFGAGSDYICSYLQRLTTGILVRER